MTKIQKTVQSIMDGLKEYNPVNVQYGKDEVVGFPNDVNGCDLVIYVKQNEITMTFGFHHAHFSSDDINSVVIHSAKLLSSEYASVEFFSGDKDLFGGARLSSTCNFNTIDDIVNCYSVGQEKVANGIYELIKKTPVNVCAVNFDNTVNSIVSVSFENGEYRIETIR